MITNRPVNAMASPGSWAWEARATPAFALLDSNGKDGDGSNTDVLFSVGLSPSCCLTGVGVEAAAVSDG